MSGIVMAALLLVRVSLSLLLRVSGVRLILTATTVAAVAGGVGSAATMPPRSLTAHAAHAAHDQFFQPKKLVLVCHCFWFFRPRLLR